tara:strand:+ start:2070 stop:2513 length:444 start_codon:yes stop_codon:yes gene_type:complete
MAITITRGAGLNTFTSHLELDLYAGSPVDGELWQGTDYPGALTAFQPSNVDRINVSGMKLLCGTGIALNYKAAAITLQVGGEATQIITFMLGSPGTADHSGSGLGSGVTGALSDTGTTGVNNTLTLTFPGGISDVTLATIPIWMICA